MPCFWAAAGGAGRSRGEEDGNASEIGGREEIVEEQGEQLSKWRWREGRRSQRGHTGTRVAKEASAVGEGQ